MRKNKYLKKMISFVLLLILAMAVEAPFMVYAEESEQKVVRVGWYESPFNMSDEYGRQSGYAYEYQQAIASYTGWTFEYVKGSWPELMEMLIDGEIDLMSDVSYTEERTEHMLFSTLPMGTEEYFLFAAPDNREIDKDDLSTINGKKIGVNKGSVQIGLYQEWAKQYSVHAELVELTCSEDESLEMLNRGEIDLFLTMDVYGSDVSRHVPICKIGSSDFFFAVNKSRPDLLKDLNFAMNRIQDVYRYYNQQLFNKYFYTSGVNLYLDKDELEWLESHGPIRIGYQDHYLAFCAQDPATGDLTGALSDVLDYASDCLENAHLDFEAVAYPTAEDAMAALQNGEIDCMFPSNLSDYDGEMIDVSMTQPLMRTDISAIVRTADHQSFRLEDTVVVAVNEGNPNYDLFLVDHFPHWTAVHYPTTQDCLKAVANGKADCLLISNYRYNNIANLCQKYNLLALSTGVEMDYYFAVRKPDKELFSIMTKMISIVPDASVNAALSHYFTEDARMSVGDFLRQNMAVILAVISAILLVIILLLLRGNRAKQKVKAGQRLISATEIDKLTGLYYNNYFYEYANLLYRENPGRPMDAVVLNIEQFRTINSANGRAFGDQVLRTLGAEIRAYLKGTDGIGSRFEGNRFLIYCKHMKDCHVLYNRLQKKLMELTSSFDIRLDMGVMPWQKDTEPVHLFEQAHIACNLARKKFTEHLVVFDDEVRRHEAFQQRLLVDLHRAVQDHEFEVYYQPKFDVQTETPKLKSAEALVRWHHPELGMVRPDEFIPLFENNGLIGTLDKYVWAETARQIARWRDEYGIILPVSVNLSRMDVFDPTLEQTLDTLLKENGLACDAIKLEVTESAYTDDADQVIAVIERLRKKGYEIEMDDFGTGYSSLGMLSSMPIDYLKMDRSFIRNIEHEKKDILLVEMVLGIAEDLNIPVIAEGVETAEQLQLLKQKGCTIVQGFYFSKPLPAEEFEKKYFSAV